MGTEQAIGGAILQNMAYHAASTIVFLLLLAATAPVPENNLNILGESPNTALLSSWAQRVSRSS